MATHNPNSMPIRSQLCQTTTKPRETRYSEQGRSIFGFKDKLNQAMIPTGTPGSTNQRIAQSVRLASQKYGVPEKLIYAVIKQESGFKPKATSHCGAQGLMQLMPKTAKAMGVRDSYNIEQNIDGGTKYLSRQLKTFGGNTKLALAAYNAGPGAVMKYNKIPPYKETQNYVKTIMASLDRGNVGMPKGLPAAPGGSVRGPEAQTLMAQYQNVNDASNARQVAYNLNTDMGISLAQPVTSNTVNKNEEKPLPPSAILV